MSARDQLAWQDGALCAQVDPSLWFPDSHETSVGPALRICARCDVRQACLDYAMDGGPNITGVWGC